MMNSIHSSLSKKMNKCAIGKLYTFLNPHALTKFYFQTDPRCDTSTCPSGFGVSLEDMETVMILEIFSCKKSNFIKLLTRSGLVGFTLIDNNIAYNFKTHFKDVIDL